MSANLSALTREAVMLALAEFRRLGREVFLQRYGFGEARDYFVRDPVSGLLCDSKAIAGAAYGHARPQEGALAASAFSGGVATVVRRLRELNFDVVAVGHHEAAEDAGRRDWSPAEVDLLVADYLQMLTMELTGQAYSKSARRRALLPLLDRRSEAAIEFKHRNVSAVMNRLGLPRIRGYLPAENAQTSLLMDVVGRQLELQPALNSAAEAAVERPAVPVEVTDFASARADAPARRPRTGEPAAAYARRAVRRDYLERETRNRSLGAAGERFIVDFERWRLLSQGLGQLADRVEHVAQTKGDGLGYDVLSYEADGTARYIEVKTTAFSEETPFYVTSNELSFARETLDRFRLCRVFDFRTGPRFYELPGPFEQHFLLVPATYRASLS